MSDPITKKEILENLKHMFKKNESKARSYIRGLLKVKFEGKFSDEIRQVQNDFINANKESVGLEKWME